MIVRILGEGQWKVADAHIDALNHLDSDVEEAIEAGDDEAFASALAELLKAIKVAGHRLPDDSLQDSDLILPAEDSSLGDVRDFLGDEGLIPG